jgi:hypothetical protein
MGKNGWRDEAPTDAQVRYLEHLKDEVLMDELKFVSTAFELASESGNEEKKKKALGLMAKLIEKAEEVERTVGRNPTKGSVSDAISFLKTAKRVYEE